MIPGIISQQAFLNSSEPPVDAIARMSSRFADPELTLSSNGRTVTHTGTNNQWRHAGMMDAKASGKWYCEVTHNFVSGSDSGVAVGNYKVRLRGTYLASDTNAVMHVPDGRVIYNNGNQGGSPGSYTTGTVIGVALDADAGTVRFNHNGGGWSSAYSIGGGGAFMLLIQMWKTGDEAIINFGQEPFAYTPYSGHIAWSANDVPSPARYWRYHVALGDSSNTSVAEIALRETTGGANGLTGGTPSQLSTFSSPDYTADKALDGNQATIAHCANNQANGWWWQYDLGSGNDLLPEEMVLTMRSDGLQYAPDWRLAFSYDGTTFYPFYANSSEVFTQGQTKIYDLVPVAEAAPSPTVETEDQFYYNVAFQLDATGKSDGASYTADDSKYAHTITLNGGMAIAGEKLVFDGTNDYIYHNNTYSALFTPGHMTSWELFGVEFASISGTQMLFANYRADNGGHGWTLYYESGNLYIGVATTNSATVVVPLSHSWTPKTDGTAYDILLTWDRAVFRLYIDGVFVAHGLYSGDVAQTTNVGVSVGCDFGTSNTPRNFFNGKMRGVRMTCGHDRASGSTTTYLRHALPLTKTQSALSDALWGNVVFLLHGEGADASTTFRDLSPYDRRMTAAGAVQNDTDISVGDSPSVKFDADGNYLVGAYGPELDLGATSPDFCMEAYVYGTQFASVINQLFARRRNSNNWAIWVDGNNVNFLTFNGTSATSRLNIAHDMTTNTPHHFCIIRSGTTFYLFIDGVLKGSNTSSSGTFGTSTTDLYIGESENDQATRYWRGNLNWMRITMGASRYNLAGFTPPTVPLAIS